MPLLDKEEVREWAGSLWVEMQTCPWEGEGEEGGLARKILGLQYSIRQL